MVNTVLYLESSAHGQYCTVSRELSSWGAIYEIVILDGHPGWACSAVCKNCPCSFQFVYVYRLSLTLSHRTLLQFVSVYRLSLTLSHRTLLQFVSVYRLSFIELPYNLMSFSIWDLNPLLPPSLLLSSSSLFFSSLSSQHILLFHSSPPPCSWLRQTGTPCV